MTEYHTFMCDQDEFTANLNEFSAKGWSLFGFEVAPVIGPYGTGVVRIVAVMIRQGLEKEKETPDESHMEAMPMKG